jgi:hypothetical protein
VQAEVGGGEKINSDKEMNYIIEAKGPDPKPVEIV